MLSASLCDRDLSARPQAPGSFVCAGTQANPSREITGPSSFIYGLDQRADSSDFLLGLVLVLPPISAALVFLSPDLFPASSQFGSLILHPLCPLRGSPFLFLQPLPRCGPRHSFASILHHLRGPFPFSFLLFLAPFLPFRDSGLCRSFTGSTRSARR